MSIVFGASDLIIDPVLDEGHVYRTPEGKVVQLSVTRVLRANGYSDGLRYARPEDVEAGGRRGTAVHLATAKLDTRRWGGPQHVNCDGIEGYVDAYRKFCKDFDWYPLVAEKSLAVRFGSVWCGMTIDRIGLLGSRPTILDVKTSASVAPWWGLQLAAYVDGANLLCEKADYKSFDRRTVRLKPDGTYHRPDEWRDPCDLAVFMSMLQTAVWKMNQGVWKP
jgi:hypothetical protein